MTSATHTATSMGQTGGSFGPLRQIDAGRLNVGYAEVGATGGSVVMLLHGMSVIVVYEIRLLG